MTLRVALYGAIEDPVRKAIQGLWAVHQGLWLGLLDGDLLDELNLEQYRELELYHGPDYNRGGLKPWERAALDAHFAGCRSVLVAACGGGREALALARRGLRPSAFDCVPSLVESCAELLRGEGVGATVLRSPPAGVPDGLGEFDGAVVGWGAYGHIPGRARRQAFLGRVARHVRPGGPLLLSFLTRNSDGGYLRLIRAVGNGVRRLRWSRERVELGDTLKGTFDHTFREDELRGELAACGLEVVEFSRQPFGHAVARARGAAPLY